MATKKQAGGTGSSRPGGKADMPSGEMNLPVKEGLSEMPTGGDTHAQPGAQQPDPGAGMGGGLMPGEATGGQAGGQHGGMSAKDMTST